MYNITEMQPGFDFFTNIFAETRLISIEWAISIALIFLTMILITRDVKQWKTLALPVTIFWHIAGIQPSRIWYIAVALVFTLDILSLQHLGQALSVFTKVVTDPVRGVGTIFGKSFGRTLDKPFQKWYDKQQLQTKIKESSLARKTEDSFLKQDIKRQFVKEQFSQKTPDNVLYQQALYGALGPHQAASKLIKGMNLQEREDWLKKQKLKEKLFQARKKQLRRQQSIRRNFE